MFRYRLGVLAAVLWAGAGWSAEVRLTVEEPAGVARRQWPVSSGIPLPEGTLRDDQAAALFDAGGGELPLQTETVARWPDGSVRWLLLDFPVDLAAKEKRSLTLRCGTDVGRARVENPVRIVTADDGKVTIETGPARLEYDPQKFMPQGTAWLTAGTAKSAGDQRLTFNCKLDGLVFWDENRQALFPFGVGIPPAEFAVEQAGPVRVCLRATGCFGRDSVRMFRYVARIHAWRGQPWIRVFFTLINDRQDVLMAKFRGLEMRFWCRGWVESTLLDGQSVDSMGRLFQVDEKHVRRDDEPADGRARGWAATGSEKGGLAVGLRDFWQNWPKAINADEQGCIGLELFPELPQGLYDGKPLEEENRLYYALRGGQYTLKVGVAKTHEVWVHYFAGKPNAERLGDFFRAVQEPLLAVADPAFAGATRALGDLPPADPTKYAGYDAWFDRAFATHLARREKDREYGLLNYGDWYGERKVNWGNLEYDLAHGLFLQYLRTGDRRYFLRGEQAARHHLDVDVIHAVNPLLKNPWGPAPQVGEIWLHCLNHTGGYYENAPLPVERTYQMGHSTNFGHVWVGGDFEYYYLTGDRRAKEVAIQMADAMVRHCPTAYSDHIRGLGWPIVLVLNAYEATGDRKYLAAATACWEVLQKNLDIQRGWVVRLAAGHCMHPERTCYGNVPFMEGLTVSALARYHRLTQNPEVLRAITTGIDQMIRECWVEQDKAFRYTACPLSTPKTYISLCLAAEALAYEGQLTGNREHLRILSEGLRETFARTGSGDGKSLAQLIHFTPYALRALGE